MVGGGHKLFFVSHGVLKDIDRIKRTYPVFGWLSVAFGPSRRFSQSIDRNKIREIYHFSSAQIHGQLAEIKFEINEWLKEN
jgi:hypothetical protein